MNNLEKQNILAEVLSEIKNYNNNLKCDKIEEYTDLENFRLGLNKAMDFIEKKIEDFN